MNDRFTNGFIAGVLGGVAMSAINFIAYKVGISDLLYLDWVCALLYGHQRVTLLEAVVGQIGKLFFAGLLGSFFAFWLTVVTSKYLSFKGVVFGITVWFGAHAAVTLLKLSSMIAINSETVLTYKVEAVVFGLVMAESMRRLSRKQEKTDGC